MTRNDSRVSLSLFGPSIPQRHGHATIEPVNASSILTPATGFMSAYDYTLNPYSGCAFGCTYCYAAFFARDAALRDTWGSWVRVKENAITLLQRMRKDLRGKSIYMSSVTDPYQPIERKLELVRDLLRELIKHQPRLVIQTRSNLVTRDIDLFSQFKTIRVNMTVTTDSERVRKVFEPSCPGLQRRLDAIAEVQRAGIATGITMTPLLPLENPETFAKKVAETKASQFVVQPFHSERGKFVAGTRGEAMELLQQMDWRDADYTDAVTLLRKHLPSLDEGREGFAPA